jgi:VWFA-related protein
LRFRATIGTAALWGAVTATTPAQTPARSPTPAFPARTEAVTVDVVVLDKDGVPVAGLGPAEFTIREDGVTQSVTAFESIAAPEAAATPPGAVPVEVSRPPVSSNTRPGRRGPTFVVVFDDAHLTPLRGEAAREAIASFLALEGRPGDRVTLAPTSGGTWWTAVMPQGAADLAGALGRLKGLRLRDASARQMSDFEALRISRYRDERLRNEVFTRLIEMDQIGDPDSGPRGGLKGLDVAPGRTMVESMAAQIHAASEARMKVTLDLLDQVLASLAHEHGRKTVLLVSEGFVHDPQFDRFARVARRAAEANAEVAFVDARSLEGDLPAMAEAENRPAANPARALDIVERARRDDDGAESVALDTGGLVVRGGNDLAGALGRATRASRAYYLLGYQPTNTAHDGTFRRIEVTVRRPGLTVRARKGYHAPTAEAMPPARAEALDPEVQRALDAPEPSADIPMRLAAYRLAPPAGGKTKVRLVAELDAKALAFTAEGDRAHDMLETFFLVASRATGGGESHQAALDLNLPEDALARLRATWLPVQRDFDLAPGVYQARVAVRDANARRVASVVHDFEVPPAAGLAFTSPVLTDTVIAAEGAGGPPRPALVARRTFAAGARLYAQFEVTGAAGEAAGGPRVRAGHELRRVDGLVLAHLDPTPMPPGPEGRVTRLLAISLRDARPGEHELILTARDDVSGHVVETREPFLVAAPEEAAMQGALVALPGSPPPPRQTQVVRPPSGSPQSPPATRDLAGYQSLVRRYGAEARDRAVLELASWPPGRLKDVARAHEAALVEQVVLASGQGARRVRPDLEAQTAALDAALLLTEAALLRVGDEEDGLEAAKRLFEALGGSPDGRERHKKWALAVSGHFLDQSRVDGARRWAEEARRVDGSDAAVLVALGVVSEIQVTLADAHGGLRPVSSPGREAAPIGSESLPKFQSQAARERLAREAEDLYDRALEHEPDSVEARLRRGRLRARRGRAAEADADLDWVAAHATDVRLRAVAHLLLARQADGQGRTEPALRHYESALELAPGTLSALIGRSELLARSGRAREAAESLTSALSRRTGPEVVDPWLAYHLGFHPRTADVFTALRGAGRP